MDLSHSPPTGSAPTSADDPPFLLPWRGRAARPDPTLVQPSLRQRLALPKTRWPSRPIRLAFVITDLDAGGAERALVSLATRLDPERWYSSVFCLMGPGPMVEVLRQAGIPCESLALNRHGALQGVVRLAAALRRFRPELVQSFLFHANLATRLAAPWAGRPWVVGGLRVAEHEKRWHLALDRATSRLSLGSVCVSHGVEEFSRRVTRLDPDRLTVISNGIDPTPYDHAIPLPRLSLGIPESAHLALQVGRLDRQKGLGDLLEAAKIVVGERPDWHLALVGDGPERGWLIDRLSRDSLLTSHVHWLGPRDDVDRLLKTADVVVLASHWEGMPNVVLEAMAASRAVVATAVEGSSELVAHHQTGWLTPAQDPVALAKTLLEAAQSPEQRAFFGAAGRHRAGELFAIDATVVAYERLWAGVLGFELPG